MRSIEVAACLVLWFSGFSSGMRRGPHHPHGYPPVTRSHSHYRPLSDVPLTSDRKLLHDRKHIHEDTKVLSTEALYRMTSEELEFYYFSTHDFDRNSKLDGLELLKAVVHTMEHELQPGSGSGIKPKPIILDGYISMVDMTLERDDRDDDGYLSYGEYRAATGGGGIYGRPGLFVDNTDA